MNADIISVLPEPRLCFHSLRTTFELTFLTIQLHSVVFISVNSLLTNLSLAFAENAKIPNDFEALNQILNA